MGTQSASKKKKKWVIPSEHVWTHWYMLQLPETRVSISFFKSYFIFKNFTHIQNVYYFIYNILCPFYLPQDTTTHFPSTVLSILYYYYYHYFIIFLSPLGTGHVHMAVELSLGCRKPTLLASTFSKQRNSKEL